MGNPILHLPGMSINLAVLQNYNQRLAKFELQKVADSIKKAELESMFKNLKTRDNLQKNELLDQITAINEKEKQRISDKKARIDSLRSSVKGYPVLGITEDTLFTIYSKIGASTPKERATNITRKIRKLYDDDFLRIDSIVVLKSENHI
jgi:hypothetical protein